MKHIILSLSVLLIANTGFASEASRACEARIARAVERFATQIVYPGGRLEDRAQIEFKRSVRSDSWSSLNVYDAQLNIAPSGGVLFDVYVEPSECRVREIRQTYEE